MTSGVKLLLGAVLAGGAIGYLAIAGAANNWQYYLSVDEAVDDAATLIGRHVRVNGRVSAGSLAIGRDRREATFELHGERRTLPAKCRCLLPDNLAENMEVVVEGTLRAGCIDGHKVITRCASKYQAKQAAYR